MRSQYVFCNFSHNCLYLIACYSAPCFHVIQFELNRSTSPPGGNIRPMESMAWAHFGKIFELFIELHGICTHFSYIEYV